MSNLGISHPVTKNATQGFILDDGDFVDRKVALTIAKANGQYKLGSWTRSQLFSEDVW